MTDGAKKEATTMTLEGQGSWLRLSILGYQFPKITDDTWDSNWLVVVGHVCVDGNEWQFSDPCLTTFEVMWLAEWLEALPRGTAQDAYCVFTEPNLEFERLSDSTIRVRFSHESAPPWAKQHYGQTEYGFEVPISPRLAIAAEQLKLQLARFPERAGGLKKLTME